MVATAFAGPLAGAAAKTSVQHLAKAFTDTATKRFLDAGRVWDSEQAQRDAIVAYFTEAVGPWFESLREQLNDVSERNAEQFLQKLRFIERNVANREGQELSLDLLRELIELARAAPASHPPRERPIPFDGPGRVPAKPVPNFSASDELERLEALLDGSSSAVCIVAQGMGGIGKTMLAQHYVASHARVRFPAGAVWIDAENLSRDLPYAARCFGWIEQRDPTLEEANRYLSQELHRKHALVIVDNVDPTLIDVRALPFPGGCTRTLLTSRHITLARTLAQGLQIESVPLELSLWSLRRCRAYLRQVALELAREPDEELDALSEFVGCLPLALQLIANQPVHDRGISAADLLRQLQAEPIDTLERFVGTAGGLTRGVVQTFVASLNALGAGERQALRALAVCASGTRTEIVAAVARLDNKVARTALNRLTSASLAQHVEQAAAPWALHDVIRALVCEQAKAQGELVPLEAAHQRWVEQHIDQYAEPTRFAELEAGVAEGIVCVRRLLGAGRAREASELFLPLCDHLRRRGEYPKALRVAWRFVDSNDDELVQAPWLGNLGLCYQALGEVQKAIDLHQRAFALNERLGVIAGQASDLGHLGSCYQVLGNLSTAIGFLKPAVELSEKLGLQEDLAVQLGNLGVCYHMQGNIPKAIELLERALALNEQLRRVDGQASALDNLGLCYHTPGHIPRAIELHKRALKLSKTFGDVQRQAAALGNLGVCHQILNDIPKALELHKCALKLNERLNRLEGQAIALGNIGNCYQTLGDLPTAIGFLEQALALFTQLGQLEGQANQLGNLGTIYAAQGRFVEARADLERSLKLFLEIGLGDAHPSVGSVRNKLKAL